MGRQNISLQVYFLTFNKMCNKNFENHLTNKTFVQKNEHRHNKTNKMSVCPAKTQISLGIRPV